MENLERELKAFKAGYEYAKEQMYTKEDLETAWKSSEQNMHFQFNSSAYKGIIFEQWFNSFKDIKNE
jgi:hypothetical protein